MDSLDKKFKAEIKNTSESIPSGYSWDEMKTGINQNLSPDDKIDFKHKKRNPKILFWLLLLIVIVSLFIVLWFRGTLSNEPTLDAPENQNYANVDIDSSPENIVSELLIGDSEENIRKESSQLNLSPPQAEYKSKNTISNESLNSNNDNLEASFHNENMVNTLLESANGSTGMVLHDEDKFKNSAVVNKFNFIVLNPIAKLNSRSIQIKRNYPSYLSSLTNITEVDIKDRKREKWAIAMNAGSNLLSVAYSGAQTSSTIRNKQLDMIMGRSIGLSLSRTISNDGFIDLGLGFEENFTKTELVFNQQVEILIKDALVQIDSNVITKRKTFFRKDTLVNTVEKRTIRHYNKISSLNLNIHIGKEWYIKPKWTFHGKVGLNYKHLVSARGRYILEDNSILDFDEKSSVFCLHHFAISGSLGISYLINDRMSIGNDIFIIQNIDNWSSEKNLKYYPTLLSYQLSFKYCL